MQTATGIIKTDEEADIFVHDLGIWVTAVVLKDSPAVLSLSESYAPKMASTTYGKINTFPLVYSP